MGQLASVEIKELIRSRSDIVEVVSEYLPLKKSGVNYKGLCPFHSEKSPSFLVHPEKQIFHCFGCGVGGDVFSFVSKMEQLSFPETIERLGKRCGIETKSPQSDRDAALTNRLLDVNNRAADFYHRYLLESPEGQIGLRYLEKRGVGGEAIKAFKLGYAGSAWEGIQKYLKRGDVPGDLIEKAGLARERGEKGQGQVDRFRKRLLFPITDLGGEVVGFGGRVTAPEANRPKYLNSPETAVYKKSRVLYGLQQAREEIKKTGYVLIVEGYLDVIALYQAGFKNVIATSGTALTEHHARLIKRFTDRVFMLFDGDSAGIKAAERGSEILIKEGLKVRLALFPDGEDPDSFVLGKGAPAFQELLDKAPVFMEFIIDREVKERSQATIDNKVVTVNRVMPFLSLIKNAVERDHYLSCLAGKLGVSERSLLEELRKETGGPVPGEEQREFRKEAPLNRAEKILVQLMLKDFSNIEQIRGKITCEQFEDRDLGAITNILFQLREEEREVGLGSIVDRLRGERSRQLVFQLAAEETSYMQVPESIEDSIRDIQRKKERLSGPWKAKNSKVDRVKELLEQVKKIKGGSGESDIIH